MKFNSYNYIDGNTARKVEENYSNVVYVQPKRIASNAPVQNRSAERIHRSSATRSAQYSAKLSARENRENASQKTPRTRTDDHASSNQIVTNWHIPTNLQMLGMAIVLNTMMLGTVFLGA